VRELFPQLPIKPQIEVDEPFGENLPGFGICRRQVSVKDIRIPFGIGIIAVEPARFANAN
jgi:hypothetical protein